MYIIQLEWSFHLLPQVFFKAIFNISGRSTLQMLLIKAIRTSHTDRRNIKTIVRLNDLSDILSET